MREDRQLVSFNSIVVRLKVLDEHLDEAGGYVFQFHSGSIKSIQSRGVCERGKLFQFHSGSIKSPNHSHNPRGATRFNSIVVRLKGRVRPHGGTHCTSVSIP